jgi:predicted nucleotidyltransferase
MALDERYKKELIRIIKKHLPKSTIYLFGSRAKNTERPNSDIDIAVDAQSKIPYAIKTKIVLEFDETTIPLKIDFVDLQTASEKLKSEVLDKGILWTN